MTVIALIIAVPACEVHSCTIHNYLQLWAWTIFFAAVYVICLASEMV